MYETFFITIKEIKSRLSLSQVLEHYGIKSDMNNRLCCPWHNDKTPSLQIYPKTNTWTCFSSNCEAGSGDQIDFIMQMEKCSKHEAILKAKAMLGHEIIKKVVSKTTTDYEKLFTQFQANIKSEKVKSYLDSRNLDHKKIEIGYNANTYPYLKHCLIFPLRNPTNQIVSFYGRSIYDKENAKHFYLKNRTGLYPSYPKAETKVLILTEAIIDAASLAAQTGNKKDRSILALFGTNGLTDEHKNCLSGLPELEEIILFFDGDEAGRKAIEKLTPVLRELQPKVKISYVNTTEGEDVNGLSQSHEAEIFTHLLNERIEIPNQPDLFFSFENASNEKKNYLERQIQMAGS